MHKGSIKDVCVLRAIRDELQDKVDSLGDVSMEMQLRLQMCMDAYSQTAAVISNVQKKVSETASPIIGNMK